MSLAGDAFRTFLEATNPLLVPLENDRPRRRMTGEPAVEAALGRALARGIEWFRPQPMLEI